MKRANETHHRDREAEERDDSTADVWGDGGDRGLVGDEDDGGRDGWCTGRLDHEGCVRYWMKRFQRSCIFFCIYKTCLLIG